MRFGKVSNTVWTTMRSKWDWILVLLLLSALFFGFFGIKLAIGALVLGIFIILGIVTIISFKPESFFAAGIAASVLMGVFLAARIAWLALNTAKIAFALVTIGTLQGAWRLWTTPDTREGNPGDEKE